MNRLTRKDSERLNQVMTVHSIEPLFWKKEKIKKREGKGRRKRDEPRKPGGGKTERKD